MNKYQLLFIIENSLSEEDKTALIDKFSDLIVSLGGTVNGIDKWGTRTLAYPINYKTEGYYVLINFESGPDAPIEIDRQMRINDGIVRQMITKKV
ncbi:MAG: 30S ribosomal protein S6 [Clostridiales bacterium]|jgi:small subunit ribosomal protein S6|nr:30S ribosomal protein S6 [Clostridiales bacterium]HOB63858.1 30S ribosomal protein S6 [Clostridia bacterium]HOK82119.1 30S ribosomal protein S6 [Clostridia bacterium]HOL61059.1 30S ribosomal protein S6 [Clostridia bacterium]HPO53971.1 30S ribosomal protein S6 [Clostridia bacterium]